MFPCLSHTHETLQIIFFDYRGLISLQKQSMCYGKTISVPNSNLKPVATHLLTLFSMYIVPRMNSSEWHPSSSFDIGLHQDVFVWLKIWDPTWIIFSVFHEDTSKSSVVNFIFRRVLHKYFIKPSLICWMLRIIFFLLYKKKCLQKLLSWIVVIQSSTIVL